MLKILIKNKLTPENDLAYYRACVACRSYDTISLVPFQSTSWGMILSITQEEISFLAALGLPLSDDHSDVGEVDFKIAADILRKISRTESEGRLRDAARAWLIAVCDHYPPLYSKYFAAPELLTMASGPRTGRDIKLRRLALSHLGKFA